MLSTRMQKRLAILRGVQLANEQGIPKVRVKEGKEAIGLEGKNASFPTYFRECSEIGLLNKVMETPTCARYSLSAKGKKFLKEHANTEVPDPNVLFAPTQGNRAKPGESGQAEMQLERFTGTAQSALAGITELVYQNNQFAALLRSISAQINSALEEAEKIDQKESQNVESDDTT